VQTGSGPRLSPLPPNIGAKLEQYDRCQDRSVILRGELSYQNYASEGVDGLDCQIKYPEIIRTMIVLNRSCRLILQDYRTVAFVIASLSTLLWTSPLLSPIQRVTAAPCEQIPTGVFVKPN
jgi:hypothetical protein